MRLVLLLAACGKGQGELPNGPPTLVSDLHGSRWFVAPLLSGPEADGFDLADMEPAACPSGGSWDCLLFQSRPMFDAAGSPLVAFAFSRLDRTDGSDNGPDDLLGEVRAVGASDHALRWRLARLDFSGVDPADSEANGSFCRADPDDPCEVAADAFTAEARACRLMQPHDFAVVEQDDSSVRMWVTDTRNARLLRVLLPFDDDCGRVEEVVGPSNPDWDVYLSVNSLAWGQGEPPGGEWGADEWLLATVKDTRSASEEGIAQGGGDGRGKVVLFVRDEAGWRQAWEFPPESTAEASFVNAPHGVTWATAVDGTPMVLFAHALGDGRGSAEADWDDGNGGSIGILLADGPRYAGDGVLENGRRLGYARDVVPLADGTLALADSGCMAGVGCGVRGASWVLAMPGSEPSEADGVWTPDGSRQDFVELGIVEGPVLKGSEGTYSVEPTPGGWASR